MNKRFFVVLAVVLGLIVLPTQAVVADENATGADPIFELIGVEKPAQWAAWNETTKHAYLRELGAYPVSGNKYKGKIDLDRYFVELGVDQPTEWNQMSFDERAAFVQSVKSPTLTIQPSQSPIATIQPTPAVSAAPTIEPTASPDVVVELKKEKKRIAETSWLVAFLALVTAGVSMFALITTIRKKW